MKTGKYHKLENVISILIVPHLGWKRKRQSFCGNGLLSKIASSTVLLLGMVTLKAIQLLQMPSPIEMMC